MYAEMSISKVYISFDCKINGLTLDPKEMFNEMVLLLVYGHTYLSLKTEIILGTFSGIRR